jgi:hypothetical protein
MAWQDTYTEFGAEIQAAKSAAIAAFMAAPSGAAIDAPAAIPPIPSRQQLALLAVPLTSADRAKLLTVTWRAIARATLKHIGPVSSDGSILIGQQDDGDGVPQLNLRSASSGVELSDDDPLPDGIANPGVGIEASRFDHVHPLISDLKSFLFSAKFPNALDGGDIYCCYTGYEGCGDWYPFESWAEPYPGVYVASAPGPLTYAAFDGVDPDVTNPSGVPSIVGKTIMCVAPTLTETRKKRTGLYIVDDSGAHMEGDVLVSTYATFRRHPGFIDGGDFATGQAWHILNGNYYGNDWVKLTTTGTIVLGTTPLDWAKESSQPNEASAALLTASQIALASSETVEASTTLKASDGQATLYEATIGYAEFETLAGTPGLTAIPAGKITMEAMAKVDTAATGDTTLTFVVYKHSGGSYTQLWSYATSVVTGVAYALKQVSQVIAEQALSPSDTLRWSIKAQTTSTTDVVVSVIVNDTARSARISLPVEFTVGGAEDHRQLTHRDAAAQHPWSSIQPVGLATVPLLPATIATGGKLTIGASNRYLVNPDGNSLVMISTPNVGADQSVDLILVFTTPVVIQHMQTADTGFEHLYLHEAASILNPLNFDNAYSTATFRWLAGLGAWVLGEYHAT